MGQLDGLTGWGTTYKLTGPTENVTVLQVNNRAILKVGRASGGQTVSIPNSTTITSGARLMIIGDDSHMSGSNVVTVTDGVYSATLDTYTESRELVWTGSAWASASGGSSGGGVTDHGALTGLNDDDHTQYVHTRTSRTIAARHTFAPATEAAPFSLGANAIGQLVVGLNADKLDGQDGSHFLDLGNATGSLAFSNVNTSVDVTFGQSITVTGGGVSAPGQLRLRSVSDDVQLSSPNALKASNGTIEYATLTHTDGLSFDVLNAGSEVVGTCAMDETGLLTQDLVNTRSGKLAPNALTIGATSAPEISLGLTTSKVPLEFKVVGADNVLTLSQDSIQSSGNLQLKDANRTSQLTITTAGTTFTGIPRYGLNPLGNGDGSKWSAYFEDFRNTVSANATYVFAGGLTPVYSGTGSAISTVACGTTEIGVFRVGVGTTSTGYGGLRNGYAAWLCFGLGRNYFKTRVRLPNLSTADDAYVVRLGWNDHTTGGAPTDGAYFRYTESENDGRWTCVCVSAGTETTADSSVSVAANTWAKLEIEINAAATSAVFKINGNTVATITTNIPSGGARGTMTGLWITKTAGTANRYMDLDFVHEVNEFASLNR